MPGMPDRYFFTRIVNNVHGHNYTYFTYYHIDTWDNLSSKADLKGINERGNYGS